MNQCMHKKQVGDTAFYCVEPSGHQCAHYYRVRIEDVERQAATIAERDAEFARLREARDFAEGMVLGARCPCCDGSGTVRYSNSYEESGEQCEWCFYANKIRSNRADKGSL